MGEKERERLFKKTKTAIECFSCFFLCNKKILFFDVFSSVSTFSLVVFLVDVDELVDLLAEKPPSEHGDGRDADVMRARIGVLNNPVSGSVYAPVGEHI